jgi:hypothetical protein
MLNDDIVKDLLNFSVLKDYSWMVKLYNQNILSMETNAETIDGNIILQCFLNKWGFRLTNKNTRLIDEWLGEKEVNLFYDLLFIIK